MPEAPRLRRRGPAAGPFLRRLRRHLLPAAGSALWKVWDVFVKTVFWLTLPIWAGMLIAYCLVWYVIDAPKRRS
jgi:hypothetical protein